MNYLNSILERQLKMSEKISEKQSTTSSLLDISEISGLNGIDDFLKQEPILKKLKGDVEDDDQVDEKMFYSDMNEYICQNPSCSYLKRREALVSLHVYEIDANSMVTICNYCHDAGYRFCLFTHEVKHIKEMDPVLDNMYAQAKYHQDQLKPELLSKVKNIDDYMKIIGIDNPCPTHSIIELKETSPIASLEDT